tara:strand:- start:4438 stop:5463 length:1026 start_codon:yes stop_codon:yes gene_type:complete
MAGKSRLGRGLGNLITGGIATDEAPTTETKEKPKVKKAASTPKTKAAKTTKAPKATPVAKAAPKAEPTPAPAPTEPETQDGFREILVDKVIPNPHQPRKEFKPEHIEELANSITAEGLLQPIVVRKQGNTYEIIAGERRLRAFKHLGNKRIPARVIEVSDSSSAVLSLIENLQREDLNPIEEALGFASLMQDFDLTQESIAQRVSKSRSAIANILRLLQLDSEIQGYLRRGKISTGHAKVILGLPTPQQQLLLARKIVEAGISVRETERLAQKLKADAKKPVQILDASQKEDTIIKDLEKKITSHLRTRVSLKHSPKKGKLVIEYFGNSDLQRILDKIGVY